LRDPHLARPARLDPHPFVRTSLAMNDTKITDFPWGSPPPESIKPPSRAARFTAVSTLPVPATALWDYHSRPGAFQRLSPPWKRVSVLEQVGGIAEGAHLLMRLAIGPFGVKWLARHGPATAPHVFSDLQERGPFSYWFHRHRFEPAAEAADGTSLIDDVTWRPPGGRLGHILMGWKFRRDFNKMFQYRHRVTSHDLMRHALGAKPMKIAISGASGLVGTALTGFLTTGGHTVLKLVRRAAAGPGEISWDPNAETVDVAALEGVDAIIHLAGENVGGGRWTDERKASILHSRVRGTRALAKAIAAMQRKPSVFISASASGFYGDAHIGDSSPTADEDTAAGSGFLAEVCQQWEAAAEPARAAGVRVVHPRIGVVLDPRGGALEKLLTPFKLGVGGRVGSGEQWMSWISLDDLVGLIGHVLADESISGPINAVAPEPVKQIDFARVLGRVLRRPSFMPLPAFVVRKLFGEMGDSILLGGTRARPAKANAAGFKFAFPELEGALRHVLGR